MATVALLSACTTPTPRAEGAEAVSEEAGFRPGGSFPTAATTGPQVGGSDLASSGALRSSRDGELIERLELSGPLRIRHDDVVVRDVKVNFQDGRYGLHIDRKEDGSCPRNVLVEYIEIAGSERLDDQAKGVYAECPVVLRRAHVHGVGSGIRLTSGSVVEASLVVADHSIPGSGAHRSALGINGGSDLTVRGSSLSCVGPGCSGALVMYGDFAPIEDVLIEGNLLDTTGRYCTHGGSHDTKEYPSARSVRYEGNHFSRDHAVTCGQSGPVAAFDPSAPGSTWTGNVWADDLQPLELGTPQSSD